MVILGFWLPRGGDDEVVLEKNSSAVGLVISRVAVLFRVVRGHANVQRLALLGERTSSPGCALGWHWLGAFSRPGDPFSLFLIHGIQDFLMVSSLAAGGYLSRTDERSRRLLQSYLAKVAHDVVFL